MNVEWLVGSGSESKSMSMYSWGTLRGDEVGGLATAIISSWYKY